MITIKCDRCGGVGGNCWKCRGTGTIETLSPEERAAETKAAEERAAREKAEYEEYAANFAAEKEAREKAEWRSMTAEQKMWFLHRASDGGGMEHARREGAGGYRGHTMSAREMADSKMTWEEKYSQAVKDRDEWAKS